MASDPSTHHGLPGPAELGFDPDALRAKYRQERDKRLRPDGNAQYREVEGAFRRYVDDPYVAPGFSRAPLRDEVDVVVVGGGFSGLVVAVRLRELGIPRVRIVEKAGDFGGTWYWNRYPGAQCDIESYIYLPLLEETGYLPTEKYAFAPEISAHARRIARAYDLYADACLQTVVTELRWDDEGAHWRVSTDREDEMRARFVVLANGPLNRPKLPAIPGIEDFEGHSFHTSRWDYAYTGGDTTGGLERLADKRVGIVGTGATAIQCVPHLGRHSAHLYVFQRTPSSVDVRGNRPTDPDWARGLEPGWQKRRRDNFDALTMGGHADVDLVDDGWTDIIRRLATILPTENAQRGSLEETAAMMEIADFQKMNEIRARVEAEVEDRSTSEALKPWYRQFCKRPTFNDEYLASFNRANVTLVDSDGRGVERATAKGLVVRGVEYPVDCLIFATGFEVGTAYTRRAGYEIVGRAGRTLSEHWADGLRTFHGYASHGFPNCFHVGPSQNGFSPNFTSMTDAQAAHISYVIRETRARGARTVEPSREAEEAWVATIRALALDNAAYFEACTPGYYNNEGRPGTGVGLADQQYGKGPLAFGRLLEAWRAAGDLAGLELA